MSKTLTNLQLLNADAAWAELLALKLRAIDTYELLQYFNRDVKPKLEAVSKAHRGLFDKYGKADDKGNVSVDPKAAAFKTFAKERQELLDAGSPITPHTKTLGAILSRAKDAEIAAVTLIRLEPFFMAEDAAAGRKNVGTKKTAV